MCLVAWTLLDNSIASTSNFRIASDRVH
jgi:hypothetical protein